MSMKTVSMVPTVTMVITDMARGPLLLSLDMVDIMARLMFMKTASMVLMVIMVITDMARGPLLLSLDMVMVMLPVMTTGFRVFMDMDMARGLPLLSLDMEDIMARLMSMKTVSMVPTVIMVITDMAKGLP